MTQTNQPGPQSFWRDISDWLVHTSAQDPEQARRGRLAAGVLLAMFLLTLLLLFTNWLTASGLSGPPGVDLPNGRYLVFGLLILWVALYVLNRQGMTEVAGVAAALGLLALNMVLLYIAGPLTPFTAVQVLPVIIAGLFGPPVSAVAIAVVAALGYLGINLLDNPAYFSELAQGGPALQSLVVYVNLAIVGGVAWLFARITRRALKESHELSLALVNQREELMGQLDRRTRQLQATISVSRAIVGARDTDNLLARAVDLIRESFGYYHVQVFLVDEDRGYATLRQSTGDVGRRLLERGHRLPVGSMSVIGQVTARGEPVMASDADTNIVHRRNELLPNTSSEMALPLQIGDEVIGALDLQSVSPDAFDEDAIPTLQALADQLAVAIQNARLFQQAEENLRELREMSRDVTKRTWREFLEEASIEEVRQIFGPEPPAVRERRSTIVERVLSAGSVMISTGEDGRPSFLAVPVVVRNEVVGVLGVEPDSPREWTQSDLQIMQGIAQRTSLAVENARLYIEAQRAAEREQLVSDIAERLQRAPSLSMLLESAAKELAGALGTENVYAEISVDRPLAQRRKTVRGTGELELDEDPESGEEQDASSGEAEEARAEL